MKVKDYNLNRFYVESFDEHFFRQQNTNDQYKDKK